MPALALRSYDSKLDSKRRITLRAASYDYYHVEEYPDGGDFLALSEVPYVFSGNIAKKGNVFLGITRP